MTIRKGEEWGTPTPRPEALVTADSDAQLAVLVARDPHGVYGIGFGDLFLSLGSPQVRSQMRRLPLDAVHVRIDGAAPILAVAHVVARNGWLTGPIVVVANCGYVDGLDLAPRAHPNDGRCDVIEVDPTMSIRQRLQARRRARSGSHLPHPDLATRAVASAEWEFARPLTVHIDGVEHGRCTRLGVEVLPDHFAILT